MDLDIDASDLAFFFACDHYRTYQHTPRCLRQIAIAIGTLTVYAAAKHRRARNLSSAPEAPTFASCRDHLEQALEFVISVSTPQTE